MRLLLVTVHAGAGLLALGLGVVLLTRYRSAARLAMPWLALLLVSLAALAGLMVVDWRGFATAEAVVFSALCVLALVMALTGALGRRLAGSDPARMVDRVGFVEVGLLDAFLVVTVAQTGGPVWTMVATGVGIALTGHLVVRRRARQVAREVSAGSQPPHAAAA